MEWSRSPLNVAMLVFDDVELLDFTGPFEVFSRTRLKPGLASRRTEESAPLRPFTVAASQEPILTIGGVVVQPHYTFTDAPQADIVVISGGFGTRRLLDDPGTLHWIREASGKAKLTTSVCTGALLLARAGLLRGKRATTHWGALDELSALDAEVVVNRTARVVDDGVITSAGVSAGIDMAFHVVRMLFGPEVAAETARYIEWPTAESEQRTKREPTRGAVAG